MYRFKGTFIEEGGGQISVDSTTFLLSYFESCFSCEKGAKKVALRMSCGIASMISSEIYLKISCNVWIERLFQFQSDLRKKYHGHQRGFSLSHNARTLFRFSTPNKSDPQNFWPLKNVVPQIYWPYIFFNPQPFFLGGGSVNSNLFCIFILLVKISLHAKIQNLNLR